MPDGLRRWRRWGLAALLLVATPAFGAPLHGVALVIGESRYEQLPVLPNPAKDARDMDRLLGDLGFDVDRVLNADGDELREAIARFEGAAKDADVALIYYSGHGIEVGGRNFLVPTDTNLSTPEAAGRSMIAVQPILDALAAVTPVSIVLLDACRSDPFPAGQMVLLPGDTAPTPVAEQGLAAIRGPTPVAAKATADPESLGAVIGFSASPGQPALDGRPGENSPYAAALLKHFAAGGYSFGDIMTMVSEEVYLETRAKQLPWTNSSLRRVLTFAASPEPEDQDQSAIRTERRKLLLSIAGTPATTQRYVESLASAQQVPLDALYGMLDVLGIKAGAAGGDLEQQLRQGAEKLKQLMADKPQSVKADPELQRLSKLADEAEAEGVIALALKYRDQASARADTLLEDKQAEAARLRQDMLDIAHTYADNAATALLNFDHLHAAELYGKAYDTVLPWDRQQAIDYRIDEGDALNSRGYYTADNDALRRSLVVYAEAQQLVSKSADPAVWSRLSDRIGQSQQTLGDRLGDRAMLDASVASYRAALEISTPETAPHDWARTQNNLANALYSIGVQSSDQSVLRQAIDAADKALTVYTRQTDPSQWALARNNRSAMLIDLAHLIYLASSSAEMAAAAAGNPDPTSIPEVVAATGEANTLLGDAISMLEATAAAQVQDAAPLDWAMLHHTLAMGYEQRGELNHAAEDLRRAVAAYEDVLTVHTRERTPAQWVTSSNNLAIALKHLSEETHDPAPLRRAVAIYRDVVAASSPETQPVSWAGYQTNLGLALATLANSEDAVANLTAAVAAFRAAEALTVLEQDPAKWEALETSIATALVTRGMTSFSRADVLEARRVATEARDRLTAAGHPDDAFYSQFVPLFDQVLAEFPQ